MKSRYLFPALILLLVACNSAVQSVPADQVPAIFKKTPDASTATATDTITATPSPSPAPSLTPTETATETATVAATQTVDSLSATIVAGAGSMGYLAGPNVRLYLNPVGTPLENWHNTPIMPQAVAGQEFSANVYGYKAVNTLDQTRQFYASKSQSLGFTRPPFTSNYGSGSQSVNSAIFSSYDLTIEISSYGNDPGNVTVLIARVSN
jgi:hypothetical protein